MTVANARAIIKNNSLCRPCQSALNYQKTVKLHGRDKLLKAIASKPLNRYESRVLAHLEEITSGAGGVEVKSQVIVKPYVLDFVIYSFLAPVACIEVNGYWHKEKRKRRDARLQKFLNYPVIFIDVDNVNPDPQAPNCELVNGVLTPFIKEILDNEYRV